MWLIGFLSCRAGDPAASRALRGVSFVAFLLALCSPQAEGQGSPFVAGNEYIEKLQSDNTKRGVAAFPAEFQGGRLIGILDPQGFHLHLTDANTPGEELVFSAGEVFVPPPGRFRIWIEAEGRMTPFTQLVGFGPRPDRLRTLPLPAVPAGRVSVDADVHRSPDLELRLLYMGTDSRPPWPLRHELTRRRSLSKLGTGLQMPEGLVLAALWDHRSERYIALSRPFTVQPGREVSAPLPGPDPGKADVLVYVDRPEGTRSAALPGFELTVSRHGEERQADVTVTTAWGVYGIWYGLEPGPVTLGGANDHLYLEGTLLKLQDGLVTRFDGTLSKLLFTTPG